MGLSTYNDPQTVALLVRRAPSQPGWGPARFPNQKPELGTGEETWNARLSLALAKLTRVVGGGGEGARNYCADFGNIAIVVAVEEFPDEVVRDAAEHVLDRLILDLGMDNHRLS